MRFTEESIKKQDTNAKFGNSDEATSKPLEGDVGEEDCARKKRWGNSKTAPGKNPATSKPRAKRGNKELAATPERNLRKVSRVAQGNVSSINYNIQVSIPPPTALLPPVSSSMRPSHFPLAPPELGLQHLSVPNVDISVSPGTGSSGLPAHSEMVRNLLDKYSPDPSTKRGDPLETPKKTHGPKKGESKATSGRKNPPVKRIVEEQVLGMIRETLGVNMDEAEARSAIRSITDKTMDLRDVATEAVVILAMKQSKREAEENRKALENRLRLEGQTNEVVSLDSPEDVMVRREISDLRTAMAESLRESELNEMTIVPLKDRTVRELLEHFSQSQVLAKCKEETWFESMFSDVIKEPFIKLLEKEKECGKWFPCVGMTKYFKTLAEEFYQEVKKAKPSAPSFSKKIVAFIDKSTTSLVEGYSNFPTEPGKLPEMFASLQDASEVETIDLLD